MYPTHLPTPSTSWCRACRWALQILAGGLALVLLWPILSTAPAHAQTPAPYIYVSPGSGPAGAFVYLYGNGFSGGQAVVLWDETPIATVDVSAEGYFDLWLGLPRHAAAGVHTIRVCTNASCPTGPNTTTTTTFFTVTASQPALGGRILYVYNENEKDGLGKAWAQGYASLLQSHGFQVTLLAMGDLATADLKGYDLTLVGPHTGELDSWGTDDQVAALAKVGRILGIGEGGYAFFGRLGLDIGWPHGAHYTDVNAVLAGEPQLLPFHTPYELGELLIQQQALTLLSQPTDAVSIHLAGAPQALAIGLLADNRAYASIVGQGCRVLWGHHEDPALMTPVGQALFVNTVVYALTVPCDFSVKAMCQPLSASDQVLGSAVIDFDDLPNGTVIRDAYRPAYGVQFEDGKATRALINTDAGQPHSPPQVATNDAVSPGTSRNVPMRVWFDRDQSHVGLWVGNGAATQDTIGVLTGYDRRGTPLCSAQIRPVPVAHTRFVGLYDALGRIASLSLDYGDTLLNESMDDLSLGLFAPANNIRVCRETSGDQGCAPVANGLVYRIPAEQPLQPLTRTLAGPASTIPDTQPWAELLHTDANGYVVERSRIRMGDRLWALVPITTTGRATLYLTSGAPVTVTATAFQPMPQGPPALTLTVSPRSPLLVLDMVISAQWNMAADPDYQRELARSIRLAANALYDYTDGQFILGKVDVYQAYDKWSHADVWLYASNNLRPRAVIGGMLSSPTPDPEIPDLTYFPGQMHMGATWNRFNLPGEAPVAEVMTQDDWGLALAHELGHYELFLFDTYLGLDENGQEVEVDTCVGSAMGWVYDTLRNSELIGDPKYWLTHCANTLAHQILERPEWQTVQLWYPWVQIPEQVDPGPAMPPAPLTQVIFHPASDGSQPLPDPVFRLHYQDGQTASTQARAYVVRGERVIDQGAPAEGATTIRLYGPQVADRLCLFDITGPFGVDDPRHQWGCEVVEMGDNDLQLERDDTWAPVITVSPVTTRTVRIRVLQSLPDGLTLWAKLYPEHTTSPTQIQLTQVEKGVWVGQFNSPVPATAAYVQVWVDETATETDPRREVMVDYGVGGSGLTGPFSRLGGVAVTSSDGNANYEITGTVRLAEGEFIALQLMAGRPPRPADKRIVGRAYNLIAAPESLADRGAVILRLPSLRLQESRQSRLDLRPTVHYWTGSEWQPLPSRIVTNLNGRRAVAAPSQGVGIYALMVEESQLLSPIYLPIIAR